jgi:hypothetical protein
MKEVDGQVRYTVIDSLLCVCTHEYMRTNNTLPHNVMFRQAENTSENLLQCT